MHSSTGRVSTTAESSLIRLPEITPGRAGAMSSACKSALMLFMVIIYTSSAWGPLALKSNICERTRRWMQERASGQCPAIRSGKHTGYEWPPSANSPILWVENFQRNSRHSWVVLFFGGDVLGHLSGPFSPWLKNGPKFWYLDFILPSRHTWLCISLQCLLASAKMTFELGSAAAELEETSVSRQGSQN